MDAMLLELLPEAIARRATSDEHGLHVNLPM